MESEGAGRGRGSRGGSAGSGSVGGDKAERKANLTELLAVLGNQVESRQTGCMGGGQSLASTWEKRYRAQVSLTEEALLEKRGAEIASRELERLLAEARKELTEAWKAVEDSNRVAVLLQERFVYSTAIL
ncbi:unnamed protein product [Discosporangium mesarthrocarpum]